MGFKDLFVTKHKGIPSAKKKKNKGIHNLKLRGICVRVSTVYTNTLPIVQTHAHLATYVKNINNKNK